MLCERSTVEPTGTDCDPRRVTLDKQQNYLQIHLTQRTRYFLPEENSKMRTRVRFILSSLTLLCLIGIIVTLKGYTQTKSALDQNRPETQSKTKAVASRFKEESELDQAPIAKYDTESAKDNVDVPDRADDQKLRRRGSKNKKYDGSNSVEEWMPGTVVTPKSAHWTADVPVIPVTQSSIVMIGEVVNAEAFLSRDKTGIYSEFSISVEEILKNDARDPVNLEQIVIAERAGGAVRFPSGGVQRIYVFLGQRMPMIGRRYLFFIKRNETSEDFSLLTGYELYEGKVISLDNIDPYKRYTGTDGNDFLNLVRGRVKQTLSEDAVKGSQDQ
jgi:hypothetical protein